MAESADGDGHLVLLAEDNDINSLLASTVLEKSGVRVVRARNGTEALAKARKQLAQDKNFDLVLMEIHMPTATKPHGASGNSTRRERVPVPSVRRLLY
jgi:CheY-like chemotaxis protein